MEEEYVHLSCLQDAVEFLDHFEWHKSKLNESIKHLSNQVEVLTAKQIREEVVQHWSTIISQQTLELQQDRIFQNILTTALENYILSQLHDQIYAALCEQHREEDTKIFELCLALTRDNVSAEKLGIPRGYSVCFPAAVVEFATLDSLICPLDKLNCLRATLDLLEAEIKGSIADTHTSVAGEADVPHLASDDIVPMLAAVLVQSKPQHLSTNLNYVESYQQTLAPHDPLSSSMSTVRRAMSHLLAIAPGLKGDKKVPIGRGMSKEIPFEDLMQLRTLVEQSSSGYKNSTEAVSCPTPLDCQLERLAEMIDASARDTSMTGLANVTTSGHVDEGHFDKN